jgi:hypothetical protein
MDIGYKRKVTEHVRWLILRGLWTGLHRAELLRLSAQERDRLQDQGWRFELATKRKLRSDALEAVVR